MPNWHWGLLCCQHTLADRSSLSACLVFSLVYLVFVLIAISRAPLPIFTASLGCGQHTLADSIWKRLHFLPLPVVASCLFGTYNTAANTRWRTVCFKCFRRAPVSQALYKEPSVARITALHSRLRCCLHTQGFLCRQHTLADRSSLVDPYNTTTTSCC